MKNNREQIGFLKGGGEMGELVRNYDWEKTELGKPSNWPLSLQTTVGIILHSAFPMFLFWGKNLLCFYNDAYRPSLGKDGKHPLIGKGGKEAWPDIWDFIGPLIEKVMTTGEAVWFEDQLLPIYRNGKMEDVYWTFSYSSAYGDDGNVQGVFVTCTETTNKVIATQKLENSQTELLGHFEQSPVAIATISKENLTFRLANTFYGELVGRKPEEILNKPLLEALPELEGQGFDKLLEEVIATGIPFISPVVPVTLKRKGVVETFYVDLTYQPQRDLQGVVKGVLVVATDVTKQVVTQNELKESKERLVFAIDAAQLGTWDLDPKTNKFTGNDRLKNWFGLEAGAEIELSRATYVIIEEDRPRVLKAISYALTPESGGRYDLEYTIKNPNTGKETIVKAKGQARFDDNGAPLTFSGTLEDVTEASNIKKQLAQEIIEQKIAQRRLEESEAHLQLTRNAIPAMVFYLDADQRYRSYNGAFMEWFKVDGTEALGKTTREFIGEDAYAKVGPLLAKAYAGERVEYHMHAPKRIGGEKWLNIVYTPHKNADGKVIGIIVHATDITEHIRALKKIEESEARFRNLLQEAPVAATLFRGPELIIEVANDLTLKYWGKTQDIIGKPLTEAAPELEDQQMIALVRGVYERGGMVNYSETPIRFMENGRLKDGFYSFSLKALYNSSGEVESILSTGIDVTEQVNVRKQIESKEKELRDLISIAPLGICVVSGIEARIEEVNDRFILISGKKPEQFKNATYWQVFSEVAEAFSPVLENVFKTGVKFSIAETELTLIRHGVPEKMFVTFDYVPIRDSNGEVSKIIVLVIDVTHQVEMRKAIEEAVVVRTRELGETNLSLQRSNKELEQFAYIASHDLQEPIRKISTFTQLLEFSIKDINEKSKDYISKIYNSTDRMTKLIRDVLAFSRINEDSDDFEKVNLNTIIDTVKTDFELQIAQTQATIEISELPTIEAIPTQMVQLFSNLMSNALKYRRPEVTPCIKILCSAAKDDKVAKRMSLDGTKKYYHIEFIDNGIGFQEDHVDKIFKIFQRLHGKTEFEGTGIGLAIALKIIQKHQGHITAAVGENGGAVFNILLPEFIETRHINHAPSSN